MPPTLRSRKLSWKIVEKINLAQSRDVWLNSFKNGILRFFDSIDSIFISIRSILRPSVVVDRPAFVVRRRGRGFFVVPRSMLSTVLLSDGEMRRQRSCFNANVENLIEFPNSS